MDRPIPTQSLPVSQLLARRRTHARFAPEAQDRATIGRLLELQDLAQLVFEAEITPEAGGDLRLEGRLTARAVQSCIVTLAPVPAVVDVPVLRRYLADWTAPEGDEIEAPEDDTIEPRPASIDLAAVAIEVLALALPEYPRAPGAALGLAAFPAPGAVDAAEDAAPAKPLAGLAALLARKADGA